MFKRLSRLFRGKANNSPKKFAVHLFFPDGEAPVSSQWAFKDLSERWLTVCSDLLNEAGPVINRNMGNTLSHFDVKMGGPMGELLAFRHLCFIFAISLGEDSEQDKATVEHFEKTLQTTADAGGQNLCDQVRHVIQNAASTPTFLVLDMVAVEVSDDQKEALLQLGTHLAGAYLRYCAAED